MELIVVVVIIGVIAGFAIPSYQRAVDKAEERRMALNMFTIQQAMEIRYAKTGDYITEDWPDTDTVNAKLGIHIFDPDTTYLCEDAVWTGYECKAYGKKFKMHAHPGFLPHCMLPPPCPSCDDSHAPGQGCSHYF